MLLLAWRPTAALRARLEERAATFGLHQRATDAELWGAWSWPMQGCDRGVRHGDGGLCARWGSGWLQVESPAPAARSMYCVQMQNSWLLASHAPLLEPWLADELEPAHLGAAVLALGLPDRHPRARLRRLPPGHHWRFGHGMLEQREAPSIEPFEGDERAAERQLDTTLVETVARVVAGADRVALSLSGGLDSSAVLAALVQVVPVDRILGVTWALDAQAGDTPYVEAWRRAIGLRVEVVDVQHAAKKVQDAFVVGEAPFPFVTGALELAAASRARDWGARMLLTGAGGDESFAGSLQAAVREASGPLDALGYAGALELPWRSSWAGQVSELWLRPTLRPWVPRALRMHKFARAQRRLLPRLGAWSERRLCDAAALHVDALPRAPRTATERFTEIASRPWWLEFAEARAQLEWHSGLPRVDVPLAPALHRVLAAFPARHLGAARRHRGLLRRLLLRHAPQVVAARHGKAEFEPFVEAMLNRAGVAAALSELARAPLSCARELLEPGALARRWQWSQGRPLPRDTGFLWPFLSMEAYLQRTLR